MNAPFRWRQIALTLRPFVLAALLLLPAACAPRQVPWINPSLPEAQWGEDYSACRRSAERDVGWRDMDERSSPFRDYDRMQAKKQVDGDVAFCMRERGYVPNHTNSR
jgi:hypothetical protein